MKCWKCGINKLSKEFPWEALTPTCPHPPLHCLRCVIEHVKDETTCSQCDVEVTVQSPGYLNCVELLEELYPKYPPPDNFCHSSSTDVTVVTLAGERASIKYSPEFKVYELQNEVQSKLGIQPEKQRLFLGDQELQVLWEDQENATFQDYKVQPGDTISLLVVLYSIPLVIQDVCFELSWGYPDEGKDVLDGSAFFYADGELKEIVNYKNVWSQCCEAVHHSGDHHLNDEAKKGYQEITVKLNKMEPSINRLFFTLSAFNAPAISNFKDPSLDIYDLRYPDIKLCSDVSEVIKEKRKDAAKKRSIIMCFLRKSGEIWEVCSVKHLSDGFTEDYEPLKKSVDKIVERDLKTCAKSRTRVFRFSQSSTKDLYE